jgi:hypothetical protein
MVMKKLFTIIAPIMLLLGFAAHANEADFKAQATNTIMNALYNDGTLDNLSASEVANVSDMVNAMVSDELANYGELSLSESNQDQAFLDVVKGIAGKLKDLAGKAFNFAKENRGLIEAFAQKVIPVALPVVADVAKSAGLPEGLVKAAVGAADAAVQKRIASNPKNVKEEVMNLVQNFMNKKGK